MEFICDSTGENIPWVLNGHLWTLKGDHVARFLVVQGVFINRAGAYIGEMYQERIVYYTQSPYRNVSYSPQRYFGRMGLFHQMPNLYPLQLPYGYVVFDRAHLG